MPENYAVRDTRFKAIRDDSCGGYPTEMFVSPPLKHYICFICLDVLRNPIQTCCGHRFCRSCYLKANGCIKYNQTSCPLCKTYCHFYREIFYDRATSREIADLLVKCNQCGLKYELREAKNHKLRVCESRLRKCPLGCGLTMTSKEEFQHHLDQECGHRTTHCYICSITMIFTDFRSHLFECMKSHSYQCKSCGLNNWQFEHNCSHCSA